MKSFSRDVYFYWCLMEELDKYGAQADSPNFSFEDTPRESFTAIYKCCRFLV